MLDTVNRLNHHPNVQFIEYILGIVVSYAPYPINTFLEFLLGFTEETENYFGFVPDDRPIENETGLFNFDNSKSLDELERVEKINFQYVHKD